MIERDYFTVEETSATIPSRGALAIFAGDKPRKNADGSTSHSLRGPLLLMPQEMWSDADETMAKIAKLLNDNAHLFFASAKAKEPAAEPRDVLAEAEEMADMLLKQHDAFSGRAADTIHTLLAIIAAREAQIKGLKAERDEAVSKAKKNAKIAAKAYTIITLASDDLQDEGDRVYLGSTNTADILRDAREEWAAHRIIGDSALTLVEENWVLKARAEAAETALAAERAKTAKLVEAGKPFCFYSEDEPAGSIEDAVQHAWEIRHQDRFEDWIDFADITALRAAITEAGQ